MKRNIKMDPRLRPVKGYKYRIIVCDQDGVVAFDDTNSKGTLPAVLRRVMDVWRDYG